MTRLLDLVIPTYNRPLRVYELLQSGLALSMPGVFFVIIDDGSDLAEEIPGLGQLNTEQVCAYFSNPQVVYIRNPENMGLARSWEAYYATHCQAKYTLSVVDKDVLINPAPILSALKKMEADDQLCMVVIPLAQQDRRHDELMLDFNYPRMNNREFLAKFIHDPNLQHCASYGVKRVSAINRAGLPRNLHLAKHGLEDAFGIDIDLVLLLGAEGDVDFEQLPHIKRSTLAGATERYPLTFAYTYYQYAKRAIGNLRRRGLISAADARSYLSFWHLLILRGLVVSYRHVHGTEAEVGTSRIGQHLRLPIHLYLVLQFLRYGVRPTPEMISLFKMSYELMRSQRKLQLCAS